MCRDIERKENFAIKVVNQKKIAQLGKYKNVFREKDLLFELQN